MRGFEWLAGGRRTGGLASRIVRVTLVIGVLTVVIAGTVSVIGASRLASNQAAAEDRATLQFVEDQIVQRLAVAETVASRVSAIAVSDSSQAAIDSRVGPVFDSGGGIVDEIIVASRSGQLISTYPSSVETQSVTGNPAFKDALAGKTGFRRDENQGIDSGLWLTRVAAGPAGTPLVIMLHLDLGSLRTAVEQMGELDQRQLWVSDSGVVLTQRRQPWSGRACVSALAPQRAQRRPGDCGVRSGGHPDRHVLRRSGRRGCQLARNRCRARSIIIGDTALAVTPSIVVLIVGGIIAVIAAFIMSRRLVEPLRALEVAAYRAATGSYVKPITPQRDDEIGQVADAFNAVALRLNALHDLSQLLASASRLDQVLDGILSAMGHIVGPGVAAIYLLDDSGRWLEPAAARGADVAQAQRVDALGESWLARSLRDADSVAHSGDARRLAEELPGLADSESVALVAPLVSGRRRSVSSWCSRTRPTRSPRPSARWYARSRRRRRSPCTTRASSRSRLSRGGSQTGFARWPRSSCGLTASRSR